MLATVFDAALMKYTWWMVYSDAVTNTTESRSMAGQL
jgi:hypothetical protein